MESRPVSEAVCIMSRVRNSIVKKTPPPSEVFMSLSSFGKLAVTKFSTTQWRTRALGRKGRLVFIMEMFFVTYLLRNKQSL